MSSNPAGYQGPPSASGQQTTSRTGRGATATLQEYMPQFSELPSGASGTSNQEPNQPKQPADTNGGDQRNRRHGANGHDRRGRANRHPNRQGGGDKADTNTSVPRNRQGGERQGEHHSGERQGERHTGERQGGEHHNGHDRRHRNYQRNPRRRDNQNPTPAHRSPLSVATNTYPQNAVQYNYQVPVMPPFLNAHGNVPNGHPTANEMVQYTPHMLHPMSTTPGSPMVPAINHTVDQTRPHTPNMTFAVPLTSVPPPGFHQPVPTPMPAAILPSVALPNSGPPSTDSNHGPSPLLYNGHMPMYQHNMVQVLPPNMTPMIPPMCHAVPTVTPNIGPNGSGYPESQTCTQECCNEMCQMVTPQGGPINTEVNGPVLSQTRPHVRGPVDEQTCVSPQAVDVPHNNPAANVPSEALQSVPSTSSIGVPPHNDHTNQQSSASPNALNPTTMPPQNMATNPTTTVPQYITTNPSTTTAPPNGTVFTSPAVPPPTVPFYALTGMPYQNGQIYPPTGMPPQNGYTYPSTGMQPQNNHNYPINGFLPPCNPAAVTSHGLSHNGSDVATATNLPIVPPSNGRHPPSKAPSQSCPPPANHHCSPVMFQHVPPRFGEAIEISGQLFLPIEMGGITYYHKIEKPRRSTSQPAMQVPPANPAGTPPQSAPVDVSHPPPYIPTSVGQANGTNLEMNSLSESLPEIPGDTVNRSEIADEAIISASAGVVNK